MFIQMTFTKVNKVPGKYCWTMQDNKKQNKNKKTTETR
jgi:hypothetical protein